MADLQNYETHHPAEMDYPEHDKTYALFLSLTKWGTIGVVALLIAMAAGILGGGGFIGGIATFVVLLLIAYFVAR